MLNITLHYISPTTTHFKQVIKCRGVKYGNLEGVELDCQGKLISKHPVMNIGVTDKNSD